MNHTFVIDSINLKINLSKTNNLKSFINYFSKSELKSIDKKIIEDNSIKEYYALQYKNNPFCLMVKDSTLQVSIHGLRGYKGRGLQKHELLYIIIKNFKAENISITRLDLALDIRSKNKNRLYFNKLKVRRLTPYTPNPNRTLGFTTSYLESRYNSKEGKRDYSSLYSYSYHKSIKSKYTWDVLRHEVVLLEPELVKLGCNTIKDFDSKALIDHIQSIKYTYSYNNKPIDIDYKKGERQINTFFNFLTTGVMCNRMKRDFERVAQTVKTRKEVLKMLEDEKPNKEIIKELRINKNILTLIKQKGKEND